MRNKTFRTTAATLTGVTLALALAACAGTTTPAASSSADSSESSMAASSSSAPASSHHMSDMPSGSATLGAMPAPVSTGDPFADSMTAAAHMPEVGKELATGIVAGNNIPGEVDSPAAGLRATLNANLQEHVYLSGMLVATAYAKGLDSDAVKAASKAVDKNAVALSDMVATIDPAAKEPVLKLWRQHIGYFVDYAVAAKKGDAAGKAKAQKELTAYTKASGTAFAGLSKDNLKADDVAKGLQHHVDSLSKTIDAFAAGKTEGYGLLHGAAGHGGEFVSSLAVGLAKGAGLKGDAMDKASTVRTTLTMQLQEHVYLAGIAVFTAYTTEGGLKSAAFKAAADTLDHNSVALSETVGSVGGKEKEKAFLGLWREHIGFFVDYAGALATEDDAAAKKALTSLDGYRPQAGKFFSELSKGKLDANTEANGLGMHVSTLAGAIQSLAKALL